MNRSKTTAMTLVLAATSAFAFAQGQSAAPHIAGLTPDRRPEGAPSITGNAVGEAVKLARLRGISAPWPGNVERIAEQGNWFTPMFSPGMTGRYDLRLLHASPQRAIQRRGETNQRGRGG